MDATPSGASTKKTVATAGLMVDRIPAQEWNQIFGEVWRRYRDWFYVDNMHGFDWDALRRQWGQAASTARKITGAPLRDFRRHRRR